MNCHPMKKHAILRSGRREFDERGERKRLTLVNRAATLSASSTSPFLNRYLAALLFKNLSCPSKVLASVMASSAPMTSPARL